MSSFCGICCDSPPSRNPLQRRTALSRPTRDWPGAVKFSGLMRCGKSPFSCLSTIRVAVPSNSLFGSSSYGHCWPSALYRSYSGGPDVPRASFNGTRESGAVCAPRVVTTCLIRKARDVQNVANRSGRRPVSSVALPVTLERCHLWSVERGLRQATCERRTWMS